MSENVSLDGVMQDPTGEEGFRLGGWFGQVSDGDRAAWAQIELEEALGAEALLLGRRTYEFFAERWPSRTGDWADRLNGLPKYVVSATLEHPTWNHTRVLRGDAAEAVSTLRKQVDGDIVTYASRPLVHALREHDLVDELRLIIFPVVLGDGERLFAETSTSRPLRLVSARTVGDDLALLTYRADRS